MNDARRRVPSDRLAHLTVIGRVEAESFLRTGGPRQRRREVDRRAHGRQLASEAADALERLDPSAALEDELRATGSIVVVEGADAIHPLKLEAMDHPGRAEWLLLSVQRDAEGVERANVWVADKYRDKFLRIFDDYLNKDTKTGKPRNEALVANIARIRSSILRDLWQSDGEPPLEGIHWWEVWLRREADGEERLKRFAEALGLPVADEHMELDERTITWIRARWNELAILLATSVPVAEIRRGQFIDALDDLEIDDQEELASDLVDRLVPSDGDAPAVCLLDTGVRQSHVLLADSLATTDMHSVTADGVFDVKGHGTRMAGLALFGPLASALLSSEVVAHMHRLESVKLLPDHSHHDPKTYGVVTARAVSLPEAEHPRRRAFCMPVSAPPEKSDQPSLWSASVDALAAGTDIGLSDEGIELLGPPDPAAARLFVVATGNVAVLPPPTHYLDTCDASLIEDPAQSWNSLVVGASTHLADTPTDPSFSGWTAIGKAGEISPFSRTGVLVRSEWPSRPDICMEGGNAISNGTDVFDHPIVSLVTTGMRDDIALDVANATSAATAQAGRLAARVTALYPDYWPETVRGILVHAADWTDEMRAHLAQVNSVKEKRAFLGRYGWGIPDEEAALTSSHNAAVMVAQDEFVPFTGPDYAMRQFRLHRLPWPVELLSELGSHELRMKVTLSYFVEPSAARRGWKSRYKYASHGLRFELKSPLESVDQFVRRVNRDASREEQGLASSSGAERWLMGPQSRNGGSLHHDIWDGTAADLAECGLIAVHPVGGWWKNGKRKDRQNLPVRYSLIVSLSTPDIDVDVYTPIATELEVEVESATIEI